MVLSQTGPVTRYVSKINRKIVYESNSKRTAQATDEYIHGQYTLVSILSSKQTKGYNNADITYLSSSAFKNLILV